MLTDIFSKFDTWIVEENHRRRKEDSLTISPVEIKVLGQQGLLISELKIDLAVTKDLDALIRCEYAALEKFKALLLEKNLHYDIFSNEIWMPPETEYSLFYQGESLTVYRALPEYILFSKLLKAPEKNKGLLLDYLEKGLSAKFKALLQTHKIDLEKLFDE